MANTKEFKAKILRVGTSKAIIIPNWICKANDLEIKQELKIKITPDTGQSQKK